MRPFNFSELPKTRTGQDHAAVIGKQVETPRISENRGRDFSQFAKN